jgi:predicted enzyme related to lactoylglutathione lyase
LDRLTGIGGIFFRSSNPEGLRAWYAEHLGIAVEEWGGTVFRSSGGETLVWSPFERETTYFGAGDQQLMVNYRVRDLDAMLAQLRSAGIPVEGAQETENGRFGWASDLEGNRFELWQPPPGE